MTSRLRLRRLGFELMAAPLVLSTGWRIARRDRRLGFGAQLEAARAAGRRPLPRWLARPSGLAGAVERLLALTPPRRYGVCLRRALILLELWSRCGLAPKLHLGFQLEKADRQGHAWLSALDADGSELRVSGPLDYVPTFEL